ncbi:MAG TPA: PKD domain-containing protein, partial [Nitrospiria bacterium]|nr:PKD domain-containing protein [Nitrospiria bacterium]
MNEGGDTAGGEFAIHYYLSADTTLDASDIQLEGSRAVRHPPATYSQTWRAILDKEANYQLMLQPNNRIQFAYRGTAGVEAFFSNSPLSVGSWNHVAATYDGSRVRIYINGNEDSVADALGIPLENQTALMFGREPWILNWMIGALDEVKIFNRALSLGEVSSEFSAPPGITADPNLIGYYPMDETSGSLVSDLSGNGNDGTGYNTAIVGGNVNNGLWFSGEMAYVEVPDSPELRISGPLTVEAWVFVDPVYNLPAGQSDTGSVSVGIPAGTPPDTYYVLAEADAYNQIPESDENNNTGVGNQISVSLTPPTPPVADAGGPYSGAVGTGVVFDGSGSTDSDGSIVTYDWDFGDGQTGTGVSPSHTYAASGIYTVTLTVTDNDGLTDTDSTTADITGGGGTPPIADPGGPYSGVRRQAVNFNASGSSD